MYRLLLTKFSYGAAKNLCTFAKQGEDLTIQSDVERYSILTTTVILYTIVRVIKEFHAAKKPIGMLCVSPVIVAKLIPGVSVTLGNEDKGEHYFVVVYKIRF